MIKNPFFENWLKPDASKSFPLGAAAPFDIKDTLEAGRKSFQAFTDAQQIGMESLQTVVQRQSEILTQIVKDQSEIAKEIMHEGTPEEKIARGAELIRKSYEKTVSGIREVSDIVSKSSREASEIINKRVAASLNEIKSSAEESKQKASSKDGKKVA